MTKAEIMAELSESFERRKRDSGESYTCLKDDAPQWVQDAIPDIHGTDIFPDDWRYYVIANLCCDLVGYDPEDWEDSVHQIADSNVQIFNSDLMAWAIRYTEEIDDALKEGVEGIIAAIQWAQCSELVAIASRIVEAVNERWQEFDADPEGDEG